MNSYKAIQLCVFRNKQSLLGSVSLLQEVIIKIDVFLPLKTSVFRNKQFLLGILSLQQEVITKLCFFYR